MLVAGLPAESTVPATSTIEIPRYAFLFLPTPNRLIVSQGSAPGLSRSTGGVPGTKWVSTLANSASLSGSVLAASTE